LKLNYSTQFLDHFFLEKESENKLIHDGLIQQVSFDTRKISNPISTLYFALKGDFRDGHDFIKDAYLKGVRSFCVSKKEDFSNFSEANFFFVSDTLKALQKLAKHHRSQFNFPIIAITGSVGKTTVKEWLYHFLSDDFHIVRSPKSYNSQIGVALSLFELDERYNLAIIEAGISKAGEMKHLEEMIVPTIGVFTAFGKAHQHNFTSKEEHLVEKERLFKNCNLTFVQSYIDVKENYNYQKVDIKEFEHLLIHSPFQDKASHENIAICIALAKHFNLENETIINRIKSVQRLALRMETFDGKNGNIIINDSYNADLDALKQSLEYQKSIANKQKRTAIIGVKGLSEKQIAQIKQECLTFNLDKLILLSELFNEFDADSIQNQVILIKGSRASEMQKIASKFRLKKHQTRIEINLSAIKNNLTFWRNQLHETCDLLVMVKASAYGSGSEKIALFLEQNGVKYLGVAYIDEGVELRKRGVKLPILVMNIDNDGFEDILTYQLEPAIYNFSIFDSFILFLIEKGIENYPIHIKFDTGMKRLGFDASDSNKVIDILQTQTEIKLQSIYSHLADSDNVKSNFTSLQLERFDKIIEIFEQRISYSFLKHLSNTEAIMNYPKAQKDMVRLGIGLYGISSNMNLQQKLEPVISWKSIVSQVKTIQKGESIGYNQRFIAEKDMKFAIIPVGYADGFKRSLGLGFGGVYINNHYCPTLGNICMDMIMVDISNHPINEGDEVEIIGKNQKINDLALKMNTIPYEVLTSFSSRIHRVYFEE
jgi:Alr-MurF fusion protein